MSIFTSGLFWFMEGIFACLMVIGLKLYMEDRGVPMPWWKWVFFGLWVLLFGFTIAFVGTSIGENEMTAAFRGAIVFGLFSIITAVGLWRVLKVGAKSKQ